MLEHLLRTSPHRSFRVVVPPDLFSADLVLNTFGPCFKRMHLATFNALVGAVVVIQHSSAHTRYEQPDFTVEHPAPAKPLIQHIPWIHSSLSDST
jgi:hypothetical protein